MSCPVCDPNQPRTDPPCAKHQAGLDAVLDKLNQPKDPE